MIDDNRRLGPTNRDGNKQRQEKRTRASNEPRQDKATGNGDEKENGYDGYAATLVVHGREGGK